jgi:hypothetical protein
MHLGCGIRLRHGTNFNLINQRMQNFKQTFEIVNKHLQKTHGRLLIVDISMALEKYYDKLKWMDDNCPEAVFMTIIHDYVGLNNQDEYFLPRLS